MSLSLQEYKNRIFNTVKSLFDRELYYYQVNLLVDMLKSERIVSVMARQSGKSETIGAGVVLEALRRPAEHIIIVAPTDRQAGELFIKVENYLKCDGISENIESISQRSAILKNGCRISAFPIGHSGDNLRGMTANILVLEEASFIKDDIVNEVLMPMVSTPGSKLVKISTPRGKNHFYNSFKSDKYKKHRYTWKDAVKAGRYSQDFIDEARSSATETQFKVEYESEFIEGADNYFPSQLIDRCVDRELLQEFKPQLDKIYFMGVDVAYAGKDKSVFTILETDKHRTSSRIVHLLEFENNTTGTVYDKSVELQNVWKCKKIYVDATTAGSGLAEMLKRKFNGNPNKKSSADIVEGIMFTNKSKVDMFSNLKLNMEHDNVKIPDNRNLIYQLQDFRYELSEKSDAVKLHHSPGKHDDYPDSLALATLGIQEKRFAELYFGETNQGKEKPTGMSDEEWQEYNKSVNDKTVFKTDGKKVTKEEYDRYNNNEQSNMLF